MSNFIGHDSAGAKSSTSPAKELTAARTPSRASDGKRKTRLISVGDGSGRQLTNDLMGDVWNGAQQRFNPNLLVGKWINVQGYGTGCVTDFNKVTRMEAVMMKNSTHTIRFAKSGKQEDLVLSRVKSGELNKGILWYFLYLEDHEQAIAASGQRSSVVKS